MARQLKILRAIENANKQESRAKLVAASLGNNKLGAAQMSRNMSRVVEKWFAGARS